MKNELKTYTIYQVYIRNFNKEGTIKSLIKQLDYIKNLGIKIIQLLPVNEIGLDGRKGVLGSPYAIKDYYKINPELGNKEDFDNLIFEAHKRDLLVMMDVVFNHTSRDSVLIKEHPEFYYKDKDGHYANHFGNWSDVYDLDYTNIALHEYITKVLEYYTNLGIDGYRFDVASLLPNEFYKFAFPRIKKINPNIILLAEAIEPEFSSYIRENKGNADCDCELYLDGFDLLYRYSNYSFLKEYLLSNNLKYLDSYRTTLSLENSLYPNDALKIGTIENHDCPRIASFTNYDPYRENIIAFSFFLKGTGFIFNGEESKAFKLPDLFNKDPINLDIVDSNYFNFVKKMISLKANKDNLELIQTNCLESSGPIIYLKNIFKNTAPIYGIFNFSDNPQSFKSKDLIDGTYINLINNEKIIVKNNTLKINQPLYLAKLSDNIVY
jgi:Glycosidases